MAASRVPLTPATTELLRDYLAAHPRRDDPSAPLFCAVTLRPTMPTGRKATDAEGKRVVRAALDALAALSPTDVAERLVLDWSALLRHQTFYKAVFRPAAARANRLAGEIVLPPGLKFHAWRHTCASLCVAAGVPPLHLSRFMGHANVITTLAIYTHLFDDDHADPMPAFSRPLRRMWYASRSTHRDVDHGNLRDTVLILDNFERWRLADCECARMMNRQNAVLEILIVF
jgi:integrase